MRWRLEKFALSVIALPFSNAAVERTFSQMNLIKSKLPSRMHQELLESTVRSWILFVNKWVVLHQFPVNCGHVC